MTDYIYKMGEWIEFDITRNWISEEEEFNIPIHKGGWELVNYYCVNNEDGNELRIYRKFTSSTNCEEYLLDFNFLNSCHWISIPDLPSLLMFIKNYEPVICSASIRQIQKQNNELLKKLVQSLSLP